MKTRGMRDSRQAGFTLVEMMTVTAILAVLAAVAIPGVASAARSSNERSVAATLRTLGSAEADFRACDRDGNGVMDYWTADVAGLYSMTSAMTRGRLDKPLRLIEAGVAAADTSPLSAGAAGGEYRSMTDFAALGPWSGYWFYAMDRDLTTAVPRAYRANTGGSLNMGSVHNMARFAFQAYPDRYKVTGTNLYIFSEEGSVLRRDPGRSVKSLNRITPGVPISGYRDWPGHAARKSQWGS